MWQTIRYRRLQAITILLLGALVTTSAVFAPLYSRAMQQAITRVELDRATTASRGLGISASSDTADRGRVGTLPDAVDLTQPVPSSVRRSFGRPVLGQSAEADFVPPGEVKATGTIRWRSRLCEHVRIVQGRCPRAAAEIAVSRADAARLHLAVGQVATVGGIPTHPETPAPTVSLTIVGVYRQLPSASWFGLELTGHSGLPGGAASQQHDDWLTSYATFHSSVPSLQNPAVSAQLPLDAHRVGVDQLLRLGTALERLDRELRDTPSYEGYTLFTRLPTIADDVRHQRAQSRVTVPLLMLQLGLLAVVVLWLVLGSATEQRRPETAVAMLRGRGRAGARSLLLRELLPVVLAGVPIGAVVAFGLCWLARGVLLPGSAPFEVGATAVLCLVLSVVVLTLTTVLASARITREPVERLLRRVPVRRTGWALGIGEALLVAASGAAVLAFVTGSLTGPVALVAPAVLALFVGMLVSHATAPLAAAGGRRLLQRGRVGAGISVLEAARTPASRRTVAIVTVASALLVFAVSAVLVGSDNRATAADQEAGALLTADVSGTDVTAIRDALRQADPSGRHATPVVSAFPPSDDTSQTMAVDPTGFAAVALFPGRAPDLSRLVPRTAAPVRVRGDTLAVTVATTALASSGPSHANPEVDLGLTLLDRAGDVYSVTLGALPQAQDVTRRISKAIHCADGCYLIGVTLDTAPSARVDGSVTLSGLVAGSSDVSFGNAGTWTRLHSDGSTLVPSTPAPGALAISVRTTGAAQATLAQGWLPTAVPADVAGGGSPRTTTGLDGKDQAVRLVGRLPRVPGGSRHTVVVDLDTASRAVTPDAEDPVSVWFDRDDPALYSRVSKALRERGLVLSHPTTLATVRSRYDESMAAWSLALGVVVGVAALLLAVIVVVVLAATTWRSRVRDLAALRLAGLSRRSARRVATLVQLPPLVVAVVGGVACGALGAHLTLADVPLFASAPSVPTLDLSLPRLGILGAAVLALVVLLGVGWSAGLAIARRADLARVRETM